MLYDAWSKGPKAQKIQRYMCNLTDEDNSALENL